MSVAKPICNMCHKEMPYCVEFETKTVSVCSDPACPNFSLLQIDEVTMYKISKKGKE